MSKRPPNLQNLPIKLSDEQRRRNRKRNGRIFPHQFSVIDTSAVERQVLAYYRSFLRKMKGRRR